MYVSDGDKSVSYPGFIKLSSTHLTFTSPDQTIELETSNIHIRHHPDGDGVEVVRGGKVRVLFSFYECLCFMVHDLILGYVGTPV